MMRKLVAFAALAALPISVSAAPSGLAWDSITKIATNADASSLQPGNFDDDFATASSWQMPEQSGGGLFGQVRNAMAMGQMMQQMMQNGLAERHYVAGSKERVDNLNMQTATITDCAARTITTLDLRRKTYKVESMDHPSPSSSGGGGGGSGTGFRDNGTRVAITATSTALGSRTVGGQPTSGYRAHMTITETNTTGESHTQNADLLGYYSNYANTPFNCASGSVPSAQSRMAMMANYAQVMRALSSVGLDSRFSVKQSGPPLPLGKLPMYMAVTFAAERGPGGTFVTERGNLRPLAANDPIFGIPAGFTQQQ